jgi:hypothetical protein
MSEESRKVSRREFLRNAGRYALTALLGGGIGALVGRDGGESEKCINQGVCRGCRRLRTCHLPQAMSRKEAKARERRDV